MVAFDAEIYLRCLGEWLLDGSDQQHYGYWSPLRGAAAALVVAGMVGADQAWRVIDDFATATRIRVGEPGFVHFGPPSRRRQAGGLIERQTVVIDREILLGRGYSPLRDLALGADGGTLRYRWRGDVRGSSRLVRLFERPGGFPWGGTPPEIVDPDGNRLPVAWWARDDRGNHYLAAPNCWGASDDGAQGTMRYWPALDPRAERLDLLMCVDAHHAVVSVSLDEQLEDSR